MNRRHFISAAGASLASTSLARSSSSPKSKKGWCGNPKDNLFGAHWYYNWIPKKSANTPVEFVPMIKGPGNLKQTGMIKNTENISHLLGFNEPERSKQGNVSVNDAIKLWPKLEALAKAKNLRLGSPACSGTSGMKWMKSFMEQAKDKGLHMDFVTLHYYNPNVDIFEKTVDRFADEYDLPVWVTEFNAWSGDKSDNEKFLKNSLKFLEKARHVERYAYYSFGPNQNQRLFEKNKEGETVMNRMGELYRDAGT